MILYVYDSRTRGYTDRKHQTNNRTAANIFATELPRVASSVCASEDFSNFPSIRTRLLRALHIHSSLHATALDPVRTHVGVTSRKNRTRSNARRRRRSRPTAFGQPGDSFTYCGESPPCPLTADGYALYALLADTNSRGGRWRSKIGRQVGKPRRAHRLSASDECKAAARTSIRVKAG